MDKNPHLASQKKKDTLDLAKQLIEQKIDQLNERVRRVKEMQKQLNEGSTNLGEGIDLSNIQEVEVANPQPARVDSDGDLLGDFSSDKAFQN